MKVEHQHVIKIPINELRELIKKQYGIELAGIEPSLEGDSIVFVLEMANEEIDRTPSVTMSLGQEYKASSKRKRKRKRNRIKTKGWNVIAKINNSDGIVANIYEPLVDKLRGKDLSRSEQFKLIREVLESNSNHPSDESVNYFLNNTLEFLHRKDQEAAHV